MTEHYAGGKNEVLSQEEIRSVFGQLPPIHNLHSRFLSDLDARFAECHATPFVGDLFLSYIPFFKVYVEYMATYENTISPALEKLFKKKKRFLKFVQDAESQQNMPGTVVGMMEAISRRVSEYEILIDELFRATSPKDEDYNFLVECLTKFKDLRGDLSKNLGEKANADAISKLESKFRGMLLFCV